MVGQGVHRYLGPPGVMDEPVGIGTHSGNADMLADGRVMVEQPWLLISSPQRLPHDVQVWGVYMQRIKFSMGPLIFSTIIIIIS